jgi:hypothetical protein
MATQVRYGKVCTDMILFCIGLALGDFEDFQRPVSSALRSAAEQYVTTLGSEEADEDQALQSLLHQLFTQDCGSGSRYTLTIYQFLILYSFRQQGHLAKAGVITQYISAIVFFGRATFFNAIEESRNVTNDGFFK